MAVTPSVNDQQAVLDDTDTGRWDDVVQVAAQLSVADVNAAVPSMETATLVDDLTPQERTVLARLLVAEMERVQ
jgi:hypothetical protein